MKKMLVNFKNDALSKNDLKSIKGGTLYECTTSKGQLFSTEGSWSDVLEMTLLICGPCNVQCHTIIP
jgi:hypothetical protein